MDHVWWNFARERWEREEGGAGERKANVGVYKDHHWELLYSVH